MSRFLSNKLLNKTLQYSEYKHYISEINIFEFKHSKQQYLPPNLSSRKILKTKTIKMLQTATVNFEMMYKIEFTCGIR